MNINVNVFSGNLTAKPELRVVRNDKLVTDFFIGVSDGFGEKKKTYFPKFTAWGTIAKYLTTYSNKGDTIIVEAKYTEKYWEKDGAKHKEVVFIVSNLTRYILNK